MPGESHMGGGGEGAKQNPPHPLATELDNLRKRITGGEQLARPDLVDVTQQMSALDTAGKYNYNLEALTAAKNNTANDPTEEMLIGRAISAVEEWNARQQNSIPESVVAQTPASPDTTPPIAPSAPPATPPAAPQPAPVTPPTPATPSSAPPTTPRPIIPAGTTTRVTPQPAPKQAPTTPEPITRSTGTTPATPRPAQAPKQAPAGPDAAARETQKKAFTEKIDRMQAGLDAKFAEGNMPPNVHQKTKSAFGRLKGASNPATELEKIKNEGLLPQAAYESFKALIEGKKPPERQEQKPAVKTKPEARESTQKETRPARPDGARKKTPREATPPPPTPEELKKQAVKNMAYRLITGDLSEPEAPDDFELSPEMEERTGKLLAMKEKLLAGYRGEFQLKKDIARLKKERDQMERDGDPRLASKEYELTRAQNALLASPDAKKMEEELEKAKDAVKSRLLTEFKDYKGKYISDHKDEFIRNLEKDWKEKHGKNAKYKLTERDKKGLLKEQLEKETLDHGSRVILETIYQLDQSVENEKQALAEQFEEKKWWKETLKKWQQMPLYKRLATTGAIAAGVGGAATLLFPPSAAALGTVALGYGAYRGVKAVAGGALGWAFNKVGQNITGWFYGKKRQETRRTATGNVRGKMEDAVRESKNWMESEKKKLELAKIIDEGAREYAKKRESLAKKEKWSRVGVGVIAGLAGGFTAGWGLDQIRGGGGAIPQKATIADCLKEGKKGAPLMPGYTGAEMFDAGDTPEAGLKEIPIPKDAGTLPAGPGYTGAEMFDAGDTPEAGLKEIPIPGEPGAGYQNNEMLDFSGGEPSGPEGQYIPGDTPRAPGYTGAEMFDPNASPDAAPVTSNGYTPGPESVRAEDWQFTDTPIKVRPGDNVTNLMRGRLNAQGLLSNLNEAQKTYVLNGLEHDLARDPSIIGAKNIHLIRPGDQLDFTKVLENKARISELVTQAKGLHQSALDNITKNNGLLNDWVKGHKGEALTPQKIQEILSGNKPQMASGTMPFGAIPPSATGLNDITLNTQLGEAAGAYPPGTPLNTENIPAGVRINPDATTPPEQPIAQFDPNAPPPPPPPMGTPAGAEAGTIPGTAPEGIAPELNPLEAAFGSRQEFAITQQYKFSLGEYGAIKNLAIGELLNQIPADRTEAWRIFGGQIPDKTISLPHYGLAHFNWEFSKQMDLAQFIREGYHPAGVTLKMSVSQFLQMVGPK